MTEADIRANLALAPTGRSTSSRSTMATRRRSVTGWRPTRSSRRRSTCSPPRSRPKAAPRASGGHRFSLLPTPRSRRRTRIGSRRTRAGGDSSARSTTTGAARYTRSTRPTPRCSTTSRRPPARSSTRASPISSSTSPTHQDSLASTPIRRAPPISVRAGFEAVRRGAGDDTFLLGCGAPLGPTIGVVDGMRIGPDVAPWWGAARRSCACPGLQIHIAVHRERAERPRRASSCTGDCGSTIPTV